MMRSMPLPAILLGERQLLGGQFGEVDSRFGWHLPLIRPSPQAGPGQ
jgi:hypothetical protein